MYVINPVTRYGIFSPLSYRNRAVYDERMASFGLHRVDIPRTNVLQYKANMFGRKRSTRLKGCITADRSASASPNEVIPCYSISSKDD